MAFDPALNEILLLGFSLRGEMETWAWSGTTWQQLHPANSPSNRIGASLAGDAGTGQVVLFGGFSQSIGYLNDTWIWNGASWALSAPANSPSSRVNASMAFDGSVHELILHGGGSSTTFLHDTWAWDGKQWILLIANQAQFHSATEATECGAHTCLVEGGQQVWQWQAGSWTTPA
ncbi:MAG TPA: hypothetical protein VHM88_26895 [Candidatus Acidoferrales bacterium]|jgi:hypothetical protein|nr:hypothetical protein [Candidatus Acidoferrales bacterium]